jgi:LysM repeat protein
MSSKPGFFHWFASAAAFLALCGCLPSSQSSLDEEKEPYFLSGKAKESTLDNEGAIEAFEKAIEANPQNGSAHFELGLLFEKQKDYAAAIYHFERFLKLHPDSDHEQVVKDRINNDKVELSKTAAFAPVTSTLQRELDKLTEEKKQLQAELERYKALYSSSTNTAAASSPSSGTIPGSVGGTAIASQTTTPSPTPTPTHSSTRIRSHTVKAGETAAAIARKYGVKLDALLAANHGLDPKRLKVGQTLNIPAP